MNPVLGIVNVEQDAPGYLLEAVAEQLDHCRHHAFERDRTGQVLQPADARLRAQIIATLRQPPHRHFERGIGSERIAVITVGIARRDQHRPIADHLGKPVQYPVGIAPVFDAIGQALCDPQPLLDRGQQQYPRVRGHPAAVEGQVHRLARDRWQARQNPRTFVHGGRKLRWLQLVRLLHPNHTWNQWVMSLPPARSGRLTNYPG